MTKNLVLVLSGLLFSSTFLRAQSGPADPQTYGSSTELNEQLLNSLLLKEYDFSYSEEACAYVLHNRANGYHANLRDNGFSIHLDNLQQTVDFTVTSVNRLHGDQVTFDWFGLDRQDNNEITFWHPEFRIQYVNTPAGLRQNFVLPSNLGVNSIDIVLDVEGAIPTDVGGNQVRLFSNGKHVLSYGDLLVWDANGDTLTSELRIENGQIVLFVSDLASATYPIMVDPISTTAASTLESNQASAYLGWCVSSAGDVNGDGYSDVIVGARFYDNGQSGEGAAFVYHGSASGISTTASTLLEANQGSAEFGYSVSSAGDVNGDGYSDVIVGARLYNNGQTDEGAAFVYHGSASGISTTASAFLEENQASAYFGQSVLGAGDVNGDGYSDVIVGAPYHDNGQTDEGTAYVYHGSASGISTTASAILEPNLASAYFGFSVSSAGDVNGDGYSDVIVGANYYSNGQTNEGAAYVFHGSASGISTTASAILESNQANAELGCSVSSAGDVNGDGYSDVIVGAHYYSNGQTDEGAAFVYHGSASGISTTASAFIEENQASAYLGWSVSSAGDVNGDGYSDVIVGAYAYDNGQTNEGGAFVHLGSASGISTSASTVIESNQTNVYLGFTVSSAGDVNGDGYSDVIVGAPFYSNGQSSEGSAFVYHGSASPISTTASAFLEENQASTLLGFSVSSAGDVNGDGYSDVIVGAPYYDNGQTDEGAAFVYHGSASGISTTASAVLESNQASAQFGRTVSSAGDVNGDGYCDVIVGAPFYDNGQSNEGAAFVYHGSASGISTTASAVLELNQAGANLGWSVSNAGDVNGDGYSDVIVGADSYSNGQPSEGAAFVYHGSASGISTTASAVLESNQASAQLGKSVSSAGDVNGDGYSDVIVGAPQYDNGQSNEGAAFVYHGSASGISTTTSAILESNQAGGLLGSSVSTAGDVNGDGYSDVIVGAPEYDNGQFFEGAAFVYHGSASGISTTASVLLEENQVSALLGSSVSSAGDVNGDGYSDVIVGAPQYDFGQSNEGAAFVYYGSASGISSTGSSFIESDQANALLSRSVSSAGDVNGDGYSDVIVGADGYSNGQSGEGAAFVYHGNANNDASLGHLASFFLQDLTTSYSIPSAMETNSFGLGVGFRSPMGRSKGAVQFEVVSEGTAFGSGTVTTTTLTSSSSFNGEEIKFAVPYSNSVGTRVRYREKYDLVTATDGRIYGPWIVLDDIFYGGNTVVYSSSSWHKGSGTASAPSGSDNTKRIIVHGSSAQIQEAASGADLIVSRGNDLTINTDQCLEILGDAGVDGTLTIAGNSSGQHGNYIGPSTKNVSVQMGISGEGWHNVSTPVDITVKDWVTQNAAGSLDTASVSSQNVYEYASSISGGTNGGFSSGGYSSHAYGSWARVVGSDSLMSKGLSLYIDNNYNGAPQVLTATGSTVADDHQSPLYSEYGGWNLVGNPYPGALDLTQIYTENSSEIDPGIYIWNPNTSNYVAIDAQTGLAINADLGTNSNGTVLSVGQAFFVRPTDFVNSTAALGVQNTTSTKSLTFSQSQMVCGTPTLFKTSYPLIRLNVKFDQSSHEDEVAIVFDGQFTNGYLKGEDIEKFFAVQGNVPGLFVPDAQKAMSIEKRVIPTFTDTIPVGLATVQNGNMTIETTEVPTGWEVYILDRKTGVSQNITQQGYAFTQDTAFGPDRFFLLVAPNDVSNSELAQNASVHEPFGYASGENRLTVNYGSLVNEMAEVRLVNMNGQEIWRMAPDRAVNLEQSYMLNIPKGLYVLSISDCKGKVWNQLIHW